MPRRLSLHASPDRTLPRTAARRRSTEPSRSGHLGSPELSQEPPSLQRRPLGGDWRISTGCAEAPAIGASDWRLDYGASICAEELAVLKLAEIDSILRERGFGQRLCGRPGFPATLYDTVAKIAFSSRVPKDGDV